jgi:phospholipid transport system transporter-binding protein
MAEATTMLSLDSLTFQTANAALEQGLAAIAAGETVFDLAGVKSADSCGVALMLAWQRKARAAGHQLTYTNVPDNLRTLAHLYGVDALLPQS